jgi:hypothetical protein
MLSGNAENQLTSYVTYPSRMDTAAVLLWKPKNYFQNSGWKTGGEEIVSKMKL